MVLLSLLCGALGAVTAHIAYVQSNLYILGDVTRRSRHVLWDPLAFDLMGLLWGVVIGAIAAKLFAASTVKACAAGLSVTLLGVAVVGGVSTFSRYRALYSHPKLDPPLVLEFEMRLPSDLRLDGELPQVAELSEGAKTGVRVAIPRESIREVNGRIVIAGRIPMTSMNQDRLLTFPHNDSWHAIFTLLLHDVPVAHEYEWSEWQEERAGARDVEESKQYRARYRVQRAVAGR